MMPAFLRHPDPDFSGFTREQVADLYALRDRPWSSQDRDFAGIPVLEIGNRARVLPLTIEYVEAHAYRYYRDRCSESFVLTNDWVQP